MIGVLFSCPGRPRNGGGASGAYQPAERRKTLIQGHFRAQEGPLGPSRKSQQQTKRTGFAALEDSIADEAPEGKRAKRANGALNRAEINGRGAKTGVRGHGSAGRARYELLNGALLPGRRRSGTRGKTPARNSTFPPNPCRIVELPGIRGFSRGRGTLPASFAILQTFDLFFNHSGAKNQAVPSRASRLSAGPLLPSSLPSKYVE